MKWLENTHRGWRRVWDVIRAKYGDYACVNPDNGEVWQYMGSGDRFHTFRHRDLRLDPDDPGRPGYTYDKVPVEVDDFEVAA